MHLARGVEPLVSVVTTVWLPEQPGDGLTHVQPLGGNGLTAPISQVYCRATSAADASGGSNQVEFRLDQQHLGMVHWAVVSLTSIAGDTDCIADYRFGHAGVAMRHIQSLTLVHNSINNTGYALFRPPPIVAPPRPGLGSGSASAPFIEFTVDNVDNDDLTVDLMVFEFLPEAAQRTPWPHLTSNFAS